MSRNLLVIMARYPARGKVKTRLARDIGKTAALRIYRQLLDHHVREFRHVPFDVEWRYAPARAPFRRVVGAGCVIRPQPDGDLGQRMRGIFKESFARGYKRVVMIGTDAPEMRNTTVRRAFRMLRNYEAVFQPTGDGGYALVGLCSRESHSRREGDGRESVSRLQVFQAIFSGIAWSTARVMTQTRRRLRRLGLEFAELPPTIDIDTAADLAQLGALRPTEFEASVQTPG